MYNFYIKLDGEQFGPFSATQIVNQYLDDLENFEDIEVMESSIGIWCHASEYPWDELVQKEAQAPTHTVQNNMPPVRPSTPTFTTSSGSHTETSSSEPKRNIFVIIWLMAVVGYFGYYAVDSFISPLVEKDSKWLFDLSSSLKNVMILCACAYILTALGALILLFKKRFGFSMMGAGSVLIIGVCVYLSSHYGLPLKIFERDIISAVVVPLVTYGILQIKENGISCWEAMRE